MDGRKEEINTSPSQGLLFFICFVLLPYLSPSLFCKRTWHPETQVRLLFWDICLSSSWSAGFLNKVIFLASTAHSSDLLACHAASRTSLDLVTKWSTILKYLSLTQVCLCNFVRRQMQSTHMFSYTWKWDGFLNVGHWPEFLSYKGCSRDFLKKKKKSPLAGHFRHIEWVAKLCYCYLQQTQSVTSGKNNNCVQVNGWSPCIKVKLELWGWWVNTWIFGMF